MKRLLEFIKFNMKRLLEFIKSNWKFLLVIFLIDSAQGELRMIRFSLDSIDSSISSIASDASFVRDNQE